MSQTSAHTRMMRNVRWKGVSALNLVINKLVGSSCSFVRAGQNRERGRIDEVQALNSHRIDTFRQWC